MNVFGNPFASLLGKGALGIGGANSVIYLLRDEFLTDDAAPVASPRICEPGPGVLTINDTSNRWSISGGVLVPNGATASSTNPGIYHLAGFSRVSGRILKARVQSVSAFGADANKTLSPVVGWGESAGEVNIANVEGLIWWQANARFQGVDSISATTIRTLKPVSNDTYYNVAIILRAGGGAFHVVDGELVLVTRRSNDATVHPMIAAVGTNRQPPQAEYFRVADMGYPWNDEYGIATQRLAGARAASDAFVHEADCHIEFTINTIPSAGSMEIRFRIQDANNYWSLTVSSGNNLSLNEVVAGVSTSRAAIAGVLAADRITVIAKGVSYNIYRDRSTGYSIPTEYASGGNFQTRTSGVVQSLATGGAIDDLISWPYTLSGSALTELNRI